MSDDPYAGYGRVSITWPPGTEPGPDTPVYRFPDPTLSVLSGPLTFVPADADVVLRIAADGSAELVDMSELPEEEGPAVTVGSDYERAWAAWENGPQLFDPPRPPVGARVYHSPWDRYGTTTGEWLPVIEEVGVRFDSVGDGEADAVVKLSSLDFL